MDLEVGCGDAADRVLVALVVVAVDAEHAADAILEDAGLGVVDLQKIVLLLIGIGPGIHVGDRIGLAASNAFCDEIEGEDFPGDVMLGIKAGLGERNRERDARGGGDIESADRLALEVGERPDAGVLLDQQTLAAAVRAVEELDVEALFDRLQPVVKQAGTGLGFVSGERLDECLTAGALVEEFDVQSVLGIYALGQSEAHRRVASGDLVHSSLILSRLPAMA